MAATHEGMFQATTPAVPFSKENGGRIKEGGCSFAGRDAVADEKRPKTKMTMGKLAAVKFC